MERYKEGQSRGQLGIHLTSYEDMIAEAEGVDEESVRQSIKRGLNNMKKLL